MKRTLSTMIVICLIPLLATAGNVSEQKARETAGRFFELTSATRAGAPALELVWSYGAVSTRSSQSAPAFYVFNNPSGGFVVISGDDVARPVLGYSRTGSFAVTGMPDNLRGWMEGLGKSIEDARESGAAQTPSVARAWESVGTMTRAGGEVCLNTALWDQNEPYNGECPLIDGVRSVTGCGPTSLSIIMYYHRLPAGSYLNSETGYTNAAFGWNYMLSKYHDVQYVPESGAYYYTAKHYADGDAAATSVARLMRENGIRAQSIYGTGGTITNDNNLIQAMKDYRNADGTAVFDQNVRYLWRDGYDADIWIDMLRAEIDAGRPLIYRGTDREYSSGHIFVVDGYNDEDMFHVNWGWSGIGNGYFALDAFYAEIQPVCYRFTSYQAAMLGIMKNENSAPLKEFTLSGGLYLAGGTIDAFGTSFTMGVGRFDNTGTVTTPCVIALFLVDKDGNRVKQISSSVNYGNIPVSYGAGYEIGCTITGTTLHLGDRIELYWSETGSGGWNKVFSNSSAILDSYPAFDICMIRVEESYVAGDTFKFKLFNNASPVNVVTWYFDGVQVDRSSVTLTSGTHSIKAVATFQDGHSETLFREIEVD